MARKVIFDGRGRGASVIEVDRGMKKVLLQIRSAARSASSKAVVGIVGEMAGRAGINEFGAPRANIPERSFMRSTFDEERPNLLRIRNRLMEKIIFGNMTVKTALGLMGLHLETKVKDKIIELKTPPNAPSTVEKKGFDDPLRENDDMLKAVRSKVE